MNEAPNNQAFFHFNLKPAMSHPALIVIDLQNDYFPSGAFPLEGIDAARDAAVRAIQRAQSQGLPVVHVQHVAAPASGTSPFFNAGTDGVAIHPSVLAAAPGAPVVIKHQADSFAGTRLHALLQSLGVDELLLCGAMTQNCVTHTALSRQADSYAKVSVLSDACATVSPMVHGLALHALSNRVTMTTVDGAW